MSLGWNLFIYFDKCKKKKKKKEDNHLQSCTPSNLISSKCLLNQWQTFTWFGFEHDSEVTPSTFARMLWRQLLQRGGWGHFKMSSRKFQSGRVCCSTCRCCYVPDRWRREERASEGQKVWEGWRKRSGMAAACPSPVSQSDTLDPLVDVVCLSSQCKVKTTSTLQLLN